MPWAKDNLPPSIKHQDWSDHQKEVFVKAANAALEEYGDDGKAIATGTAAAEKASEKENAKQFPKIFYCRHMLPGIVGYENENILVDADAMKQAAPSFVGKPVYVQHQKVDVANLQNADGFVVECFYNELDGWLWAKCLAVSDDAHSAILNKWSVSNAYVPINWSDEGQHLNVDYDRKIRNYEFTHLAIVPNPRYEEAKIFTPEEFKAYQAEKRAELEELQNSKPKGHPMFKFFQKQDQELKNGLPADADLSKVEIELDGGKRVSLQEMVNAVKKNDADEQAKKEKEEKEKEEKENKKHMLNENTEVSVGDDKMPLKELVSKYNTMCKKNAEDEEKEKKEKENSEKEEKEKKDKEEKENQKRMEELQNAHKKKTTTHVETSFDKEKRGRDRYGSKAAASK